MRNWPSWIHKHPIAFGAIIAFAWVFVPTLIVGLNQHWPTSVGFGLLVGIACGFAASKGIMPGGD